MEEDEEGRIIWFETAEWIEYIQPQLLANSWLQTR